MTFINITNHPSAFWSTEQQTAASEIGKIIDIPFPEILPSMSESELNDLADRMCAMVLCYKEPTVLVQGECVFTHRLVNRLQGAGIRAVAAVSTRNSVEKQLEDGSTKKCSVFHFHCFRPY